MAAAKTAAKTTVEDGLDSKSKEELIKILRWERSQGPSKEQKREAVLQKWWGNYNNQVDVYLRSLQNVSFAELQELTANPDAFHTAIKEAAMADNQALTGDVVEPLFDAFDDDGNGVLDVAEATEMIKFWFTFFLSRMPEYMEKTGPVQLALAKKAQIDAATAQIEGIFSWLEKCNDQIMEFVMAGVREICDDFTNDKGALAPLVSKWLADLDADKNGKVERAEFIGGFNQLGLDKYVDAQLRPKWEALSKAAEGLVGQFGVFEQFMKGRFDKYRDFLKTLETMKPEELKEFCLDPTGEKFHMHIRDVIVQDLDSTSNGLIEPLYDSFDADGNGVLDKDEAMRLIQTWAKYGVTKMPEYFQMMSGPQIESGRKAALAGLDAATMTGEEYAQAEADINTGYDAAAKTMSGMTDVMVNVCKDTVFSVFNDDERLGDIVDKWLASLDADKNGKVEKSEFLEGFSQLGLDDLIKDAITPEITKYFESMQKEMEKAAPEEKSAEQS